MRFHSPALLLTTLLAACSNDDDGDDDSHGTDGPLDASAVLSEDVSTVAFVTWTPPVAGNSWVEVGLDDAELTPFTPVVATPAGTAHEQILLGLKGQRTYHWRAVTEAGDQRYESEVGEFSTGIPAVGTLQGTVVTDLRDQQDPAPYLLTVTGAPSAVVIYDRDGNAVWSFAVPGSAEREAVTVRPGWDGHSIVVGAYDQTQDDATGGIYRVSMDGRTVVFTPTVEAHHDFVERKDGTFAYLSQDYRAALPVDGTCCADQVPPDPQCPVDTCATADVVADIVLETVEGSDVASSPPTPVFNHFDDSGDEPFWTCDHMEDPFPPVDPNPTFHQWTHGNSLVPDPADPDNAYWINYRYQDGLVKVSRTHQLLAVIGGYGERSNIEPKEDAFNHGHYSHMWPGGFLMFDNNTHGGPVSRVREYSYDPVTNGSVTLVHEWANDLKTGGMADARKLSNGNVMLNWGDGGGPERAGRIEERTADDTVVWELQFDAHKNTGRIVPLNDLYDLDPPYDFWQ